MKGQTNELNRIINQTQVMGLNDDELITRNKDRKYQIRANGTKQKQTSNSYRPLPEGASRAVIGTSREGGRAPWRLEQIQDMEETWEASRAGQGTPGAKAGLEVREAMADPGLRETMAEQETREAMAEQETREAMADPGTREAMAGLEAREAMVYFFWAAMAGQGAPWPWS
ncbi:MAG: hypothetical protein ACRC4N_16970 [Gammaproteobacteria bacterium]